ncbi:MAG: efflux RND transporter periplasmic adaptor subunit [Chitinophagaceae bacterium]|nr:efflux RND transporter periplasmic adaptor subunit [Chitinophagaceae bacterium]MDD5571770.1 efflux RND transporter periplasmic adaptor subunit [Bacteroidales bacterium]
MNTVKKIMLLLITGMMLMGASCKSKKETDNSTTKKDTVLVKTMSVKKDTIDRSIEYTASLAAFKEVHFAPAMAGRIKQFYVEIGSNVVKGQVIAVMDSTGLEQSRIALIKAATDFSRMDTLKKSNSVSAQAYDIAKTAYEIAKSSYQNLLNNTQLKAPISGVISGKYFEDGEIYSGTPVTSIGKPAIVSIVQISELKALVSITASYYPLITEGMKAVISNELYPDMVISGQIYKVYPTIDNTTKTFTCEVKIENQSLKLRPGMFAKIKLELGEGQAIMIPTIALVKETGTNNMYVYINNKGVAKKVKVTTGIIVDDKTKIVEGLNDGDELIVVGQNKLVDQSPITIEN